MVDLFNLNQTALKEALECALESGADFAELYFEKTRNRAVESTEGRIASIGDRWIKGVGLYMLRGTDSVYVYSNNITAASLINLAKKAGSLWEIKNGNRKVALPVVFQRIQQLIPGKGLIFKDQFFNRHQGIADNTRSDVGL